MPGHISRDCLLRTRHLAEKHAELEKTNTNPTDVQMICIEEQTTKEHPSEGADDAKALAITKSKAKQTRIETTGNKEQSGKAKKEWQSQHEVRTHMESLLKQRVSTGNLKRCHKEPEMLREDGNPKRCHKELEMLGEDGNPKRCHKEPEMLGEDGNPKRCHKEYEMLGEDGNPKRCHKEPETLGKNGNPKRYHKEPEMLEKDGNPKRCHKEPEMLGKDRDSKRCHKGLEMLGRPY